MPVTFYIPSYLRPYAGGCAEVQVNTAAKTVGEALEALWRMHPGVRDRVVTEQGEVRQHVNVFVGEENIRDTGGLTTVVTDGCEIMIVPSVSGG
ncbi:MAG TPA: ubiquitin-like small modifier protein 1 [Terriglobia bacterium]|jgi:molybdopterin converting factor small subunit